MEKTRSEILARFQSLDVWRGILIVLMALDHANYLIAQQHSTGEYWGGPYPVFASPIHFLTRFVTHLCAPGFFFLLGAGMVLFQSSRQKRGWTKGEIRRYLLIRGLVLIAFQLSLNLVGIWSVGGASSLQWYVGVLAALGAGMIFTVLLLDLKLLLLVIIGLGLVLVLEILTPSALLWGRNFDHLAGVLLIYGGGGGEFWVNYPLLAWVELVVFGIVFGRLLLRDSKRTYLKSIWVGMGCLVGFGIVRYFNGFGTIRPLDIGTWMGFFNLVKYPPSIAFVLLTMGINLILVGVIYRTLPKGIATGNPLLVFGRTPLFSYVGHLVIYFVLGRLFAPGGTSLGIMYLFWLAGLGLLYFPAKWYGNFKSGQPTRSWVRLL